MENHAGPSLPEDAPDREHLDLFVQASELLSSSPDIKEILDRLMDQVIEVINARRGFIIMREDLGSGWNFICARDIDAGALQQEDFTISRSVVEEVAREGKSIVTSDALHDQRMKGKLSVSLYDLKSIICVPLIIHGRTLGVIYADHAIETCVFGRKEKTLLESIARQAAVAIEHARLYDELRKVHEESMKRARKELEETQAQLFQASKMAAVGQLAAGVAHEINNPLGAIELSTSALKKHHTEGPSLKRLEIIEQATARCKGIVSNLLHFSHPSHDSPVNVDIESLVSHTIALIEHQLNKEHIALSCSFETGLVVKAHEVELSQVLMNMILNAKDALREKPSGEMREITLRSFSRDDGIYVELSDNGQGMDEKVQERIFEPFFTTKPVGAGVGLGLSICFQIIQKYHGEVKVSSVPGEGTTFTLRFPSAR